MLNLLSLCHYLPTHAITFNPESKVRSDTDVETCPEERVSHTLLAPAHRPGMLTWEQRRGQVHQYLGLGLKVGLEHNRGEIREVGG